MLTMLTLIGCTDLGFFDDTGGDDTGDTGSPAAVEALIQVWCDDAECSQVGLYGGESLGNIVNYKWEIDGNEITSGATETSTVIDMSAEAGNILEAKLTVEDAGGNTSDLQMLVGNLGATSTIDPIQAIVVMPPPSACGNPTPIVSIGGCVSNLRSLTAQAWDYTAGNPNPSLRNNGMFVFEFTGTGMFTDYGFIQHAAWYQTSSGQVEFYKMDPTQYAIAGASFTAHVVDPIIGNPAPPPSTYTPHLSVWADVATDGTDFLFVHTPIDSKEPVPAPYLLHSSCNTKNNVLFFETRPAN